ncbi:MAG: EVE domain-containing protein [Candidatus Kuenenia sp.]|nr:EVE domain-containing protein [Candidatus Kuenenia hertensis]
MQISKPPYQCLTTKDTNWLAIDFESVKTFEPPISLEQIKAESYLQNIGLIKQPRLSVIRLSKSENVLRDDCECSAESFAPFTSHRTGFVILSGVPVCRQAGKNLFTAQEKPPRSII